MTNKTRMKHFLKEKGILIMVIVILLICSVAIAFAVYAQITNKGVKTKEDKETDQNYEELKNNFQDIFTNSVNKQSTAKQDINYDEWIFTKFVADYEEDGKYSIKAKIPYFKEENKKLQKVNQEIYDTFAEEIIKIVNDPKVYTTYYNLDYVGYVNNNIISLVIMCKYKNGEKPQRKIVQCYNYDIENEKILTIDDIIEYKKIDKKEMQKKVNNEIIKVNNKIESISNQGYNVYSRDINSEIYQIDNTPNFFLGENNYLYLVYSYGNENYTSEIDLVIF